MSGTVIVYNLGGQEILGKVSVRKAIKNVIKGTYRIIDEVEGATYGPFSMPKAVELTRYIYARWKYERKGVIPYSKKAIFLRDGYECAYCGKYGNTIDHINPKSKGNPASWTNSITACQPCNGKKGARTPQEAGMKLRFSAYVPAFEDAYKWANKRASKK